MGRDDESTQVIDLELLRDSLAEARGSSPSMHEPPLGSSQRAMADPEPSSVTRLGVASAAPPSAADALPPPQPIEALEAVDLIEVLEPGEPTNAFPPLEPLETNDGTPAIQSISESVPIIVDEDFGSDDDNVDLADVEDVSDEDDPHTWTAPHRAQDLTEEVRALDVTQDDNRPLSGSFDDARSGGPKPTTNRVDVAETTAIFHGPLPPLALPDPRDTTTDEVAQVDFPRGDETAALVRPATEELTALDQTSATNRAATFPDPDELPEVSLPRFSLPAISESGGASLPEAPALAPADAADADVVELLSDDLLESEPTNATLGVPAPVFRGSPTVPAFDGLDPEEQVLHDSKSFEALVALYRQRIADVDHPSETIPLLVKIARVYETNLEDLNAAFQVLVEAFELAPSDPDVIAALDRVGKAAQRIGELAEKVRRQLLPKSPDDRRVVLLAHLVYWYERVLSRGRETSAFVSEIERYDKHHPIVLKRSAQLAAMNGDTKGQRENLARALERTIRTDERLALLLALASAHAGTSEALKHYEAALELDPTSLVALQGIKRLAKENERHDQVLWALERQAEVAPTEAERVDALLDLAELQETKFLKREAAAVLLERVLQIEPAQPMALKGLERCYHALRDWPKLVRILGARAEHTYDKQSKVELLELAAEVLESKLGDFAGAVEVCRNLLVVEPKHRRALGDLARLYEKLGDWANVATYKARLAELAPTKRGNSQELVKLGDFLNTPERDSIAAKLQYERAIAVDPTNAAAWEALQKVAAAADDARRVVECLEQRAKYTEVPRQRAVVFVELAKVHRERGDEAGSRAAFEEAIQADPSNEAAAIAMLDICTEQERWADAAPLCELLVNAAVRDRAPDVLFTRLRLATRIAAALGDAERAVAAGIVALEARPDDAAAQADLIAVASQCRGSPASLQAARPHLLRIAETPDELPADHLLRLASLQRDFGDLEGAAATLERAKSLDPDDHETMKELVAIYLTQGDFARACKLKVDMGRNAMSAEARFELFCEAGEIWARRAEELENAAAVFEEARAIKPLDPWLLQTMMWLYGELGRWDGLTGVLEDMAQVQESPAEKVNSLLAMAKVVRDKLEDRLRAAELYDQVLDLDRKRLDIFEELVRTLTEERNWERLELSYRRMITRVKEDDEPQLQFLLFHQLGLIYRDRLGDAARAFDALDAASCLRPDHAEVRRSVTELLVVTDNLDNAVARIRNQIDRDPHEPQLYEELYELFLRQHSFDKAWCAVNVLSRVSQTSIEQRRFHEDYAPMPLDRVPGQIVEQAWRSHILHEDLDPSLTKILALLTSAVARMRANQLRPEQRVARPFTSSHSRMHDLVRKTFDNASEILAVSSPALVLGEPKSAAPFATALVPTGAIVVSALAVEAQASSLLYLVGKQLAEQRAEIALRSLVFSVPELTSLLHAAVRVSRNETAADAAGAALDQSFAAVLSPHEAASLRGALAQATTESVSFDVSQWARAADLTSMRAGLLIAGDVEPAAQAILSEAPCIDMTPRHKLGELYKFATSDLYSDLRGAIGVAVQG